ncbi:MAG: hypothetical protein H0W88_01695 [Parachlamydiaceae bacterium]|nr:hypothetical protein [Parachlamydiaceae bacterium]
MSSQEQTTLFTTIILKPGVSDQFSGWQEKMNATVAIFSGFVSLEIFPVQTIENNTTWMSIQRFQSTKDLEAWRSSKERYQLIEELKPLLIDAAKGLQVSDSSSAPKSEYVTEVFLTHVKPGKYSEYRSWASKVQQIEARFPGYQGAYIQAPGDKEQDNWITILRFDTPANLNRWLVSKERKAILEEAKQIVQDLQSQRIFSPFAGWFSNLQNKYSEPQAVWKQTMLILLILFPIVMFELKYLNPLLTNLNPALATFIGNAISVTLISWPSLPIAIYFLSWWLAPGDQNRTYKNIKGTLIVLTLYLIEILIFWKF